MSVSIFDLFKRHGRKPTGSAESAESENLDPSQLLGLLMQASGPLENAISDDRFPTGTGEFGYSVDNPVPCNTIMGGYAYLAKLRWKGQPVQHERIGSFGSAIVERPIDGYILTGADGRVLGTIYISPYQKKNSALAPKGLTLAL